MSRVSLGRHGPKAGDSASLWNIAPAPGWTDDEVSIFKLCLQHHGVGCWQAIQRTGLLPGKLVQQMVTQTQRLLGQQSLAPFTGLKVDIDRIRVDNAQRVDVTRKAGLIIYTGQTVTPQMKEAWRRDMQTKYGLSQEVLRVVSQQLEHIAVTQLNTVGGEGLPGAAARAPLLDIMDSDVTSLPPALTQQMLQRLRTKLGVLVDRLRSRLGLPPAQPRPWEEAPRAASVEVDSEIDMDVQEQALCTEDVRPQQEVQAANNAGPAGNTGNLERCKQVNAAALPPLPPAPRGKGRAAGSRKRKDPDPNSCALLRAAQGSSSGQEGTGSDQKGNTSTKRKRKRPGKGDDDLDPDLGGDLADDYVITSASVGNGKESTRSRRNTTKAALDCVLEDDISTLTAMGFDRNKAKAAILEYGGSVEHALEYLLSNG